MTGDEAGSVQTRVIALGTAALMDGFAMIGIETIRDATPESVETLLARLSATDQRAVIFLERELARGDGPWLRHVRAKGGRIIIVEIPSLNAPDDYRPRVEEMVRGMFSAQRLEQQL